MEPKRETWWSHRRAGSRQVDQPRSPTALKGARPRRSGIGLLEEPGQTFFGYAIARATRDNSPCALNGAVRVTRLSGILPSAQTKKSTPIASRGTFEVELAAMPTLLSDR